MTNESVSLEVYWSRLKVTGALLVSIGFIWLMLYLLIAVQDLDSFETTSRGVRWLNGVNPTAFIFPFAIIGVPTFLFVVGVMLPRAIESRPCVRIVGDELKFLLTFEGTSWTRPISYRVVARDQIRKVSYVGDGLLSDLIVTYMRNENGHLVERTNYLALNSMTGRPRDIGDIIINWWNDTDKPV